NKNVGGCQMRGERTVLQRAQKFGVRKFALERRLLRAGADDDLGAGKIERQEGLQILLDRDTSNGHENGAFESKIDGAIRTEQIDIATAGPHAEIPDAALAERAHPRCRRLNRTRLV